jgi:hypothetical protein
MVAEALLLTETPKTKIKKTIQELGLLIKNVAAGSIKTSE